MCVGIGTDMFIDMYIGMCIHVSTRMCIVMCIDMCPPFRAEIEGMGPPDEPKAETQVT